MAIFKSPSLLFDSPDFDATPYEAIGLGSNSI
jgi:hypothetical protein